MPLAAHSPLITRDSPPARPPSVLGAWRGFVSTSCSRFPGPPACLHLPTSLARDSWRLLSSMSCPPAASVPVLDLCAACDEAALASQLRAACETSGFFYLHTGAEAKQTAMLAAARALFDLPFEAKENLRSTSASKNRGWTPLGEETLDPARQRRGDTKEGYYIGREVSPDSEESALPLHGPNVWPPEALLPGWRETMEDFSACCVALCRRLLRLLALSLDLDAGFFDAPGRFDSPQTFLRLLRYSTELSDVDGGVFAAGAHSDYGLLTLLTTDENEGLQISPRVGEHAGTWLAVPPRKGAFIVNLGDMLERWSNGRFLSTRHRVVNSRGVIRHSAPFFFEPSFACVVDPRDLGVPDEDALYQPVCSGEYLLGRYAQTHAAFTE